jgi:DNA-binding transcriptional ArsR family regulator
MDGSLQGMGVIARSKVTRKAQAARLKSILAALADPTRRAILEQLARGFWGSRLDQMERLLREEARAKESRDGASSGNLSRPCSAAMDV